MYDENWDLVCVFEVWYDKYIYIDFCEDEKAIEAIYKYMNKEPECEKYEDVDRNWDTIRMEKWENIYTVAYRGGSGYSYKWGFYYIK